MASLPPVKRILAEDIKGAPSWVSQLLFPLNRFFGSVYQALNQSLTFQQNIQSQIKAVTFTSSPSISSPLSFSCSMAVAPTGVFPCQCLVGSTAYAVAIAWTYTNGQINITSISGLPGTLSSSNTLTVLVI